MFYGRPRYDLVQVSGEGPNPWYARALAFFDVQVGLVWRRMALVHWLEVTRPTHVQGAVTYRYWAKNPDVVPVSTILRRVHMVTSPRPRSSTEDVCFVLLPSCKWCR